MGRMAELSLLFICFVASAASAELVESREKRAASCEASCPANWEKINGCCFIYINRAMEWTAAENYCLSLGGNLASIHSESENQAVKNLIHRYDVRDNPTWIGYSACQKPLTFFWSDGTRFDYAKWNPNEPNRSELECCGQMNWPAPGLTIKEWNDKACESQYPFVCVKRL